MMNAPLRTVVVALALVGGVAAVKKALARYNGTVVRDVRQGR
ncbi:hypothetical protein [Nocardioides massiliensis]|uniref:Uncharacterized protein n=1 Tax=Nocardioides massiliensis TaxID=1325935 RepID=A0ABT9NP14_9ACTN|nr:hypothetical protein [Nocardioides massiliensis]MDP9821820.1 hypothetical protein [Nocardioides massiliensis]